MNNQSAFIFTLLVFSSVVSAKDCPEKFGRYGEGKTYQNMFCKIAVQADSSKPETNRSMTFTDEGLVQVFSNLAGSTSSSTGARVYYLFPLKNKQAVIEESADHLSVSHASGVEFDFDKTGNISSPQLKMKVSKTISHENKGGVEIESFPQGLVFDLGYRIGNTPTLNKNAVVTVTDKNNKKCTMLNNDFNKVEGYSVELRYKTNEELHKFLSKKCANLDLSDLLRPMKAKLQAVVKPSELGSAPKKNAEASQNDSQRLFKPNYDELDSLVNELNKNKENKGIQK